MPDLHALSLADQVSDALLRRLAQNEWPLRGRLPGQNALAAQMKVSVVVVREALARLKAEGLVESRLGAGVFVVALPGTVRGPDRLQWAMYGHDAEHSSRHTPLAETTAPEPAAPGANALRAATVSDGRTCALRLPRGSAGAVRLELFDLTGRRVASTRLAMASGSVRWILAPASRRRVSSGVYLVRAQFAATAANFTTRVLVLP